MSSIIRSWVREYKNKGIPSSVREDPSGSVEDFVRFLSDHNVHSGTAIDIGCGMGRNALYLAALEFNVRAMDFVSEAIDLLALRARERGLQNRVRGYCHDVTTPWPFDDRSADVAVDTFCYKHQVTDDRKSVYRQELSRVLKPGGFFLLTLAGADDGYYGPLLAASPNRRPRMIVDPANGIASLLYDKSDIEDEFQGYFKIVRYEHKAHRWAMHGKDYERSTHVFIFVRR